MATETTGGIWTRLRRLLFRAPSDEESDGRLLDAFLARGEGAAFAELVRRHGPMVMGVCTRLLRDWHDAEDAFQATFLVLARRAASVAPRDAVGPWLYGVAYRTALKARAMAARRREKERRAAAMTPARVEPEEDWSELLPLLDRELSRLPEKYRAAVVLCELEGRPRKEAAGKLGVPEGTLSSRLATARRLLARRLARHGLAPSDGALAAALARGAGVPPPLLASTAKAASLLAAGRAATAVVSARVAALAEGVLKSMLLTKLIVAVLIAAAVVATGAAAVACRLAGPPPAAPPPAAGRAEPPKGDKPADEPAKGVAARIVAPEEISADDPELKGELIVTNDGDAPVRVCALANGNDGLGGAFGQNFRPDWWKSDRPPLEMSAKAVVTLAPGKSVSFPFTILRAHYKDRDSFSITGYYGVEEKEFADKLGLWLGKAEAPPVKVAVRPASAWGETAQGVQAHLRFSKTAWDAGETPEFILDMRNQGDKPHGACRVPNFCEIEWDGQWYVYGGNGDLDCKAFFLQPGKEVDDWVKATLDLPWVRKGDRDKRLEVAAGKHTVRAAFLFDADSPKLGEIPRVVSQPVEVVVGKESAWGEAAGGVQVRVRTAKAVWDAGEAPRFIIDLRNQGKQAPHATRLSLDCEIEVDGIWYLYGGPIDAKAPVDTLEPGKELDDWVQVTPDKLWVNKSAGPAPGPKDHLPPSPGKHTIRVSCEVRNGDTTFRPVSGPVEIEVGKESAWGDADGGVQARVRTPKAVWGATEAPTFLVDLRNVGAGTPHSLHIPFDCEIEVDGRWYSYNGPVNVVSKDTPLEPGKQYNDWVEATPDKLWQEKTRQAKPLLPLAPGKHAIRVAYSLSGARPPCRPVSGPIEIEVRQER